MSGNDELEEEFKGHKVPEAQISAYRQLLKEVFSSLDTEQIEKLIHLCEEATLSVRSNVNSTTLLGFLKQRSLVSPVNLEYLRIRLQTIGQSELCELIEEYTRKYLDEQPPSFVDYDQLLPYESQHAPPSTKTVQQSTTSTQEHIKYSLPAQVEDDDEVETIPIRNEVQDCKQEWEMMSGSQGYIQQLEERYCELIKELEQKERQIQQQDIKLSQVEQELQESISEKEKLQRKIEDYKQQEILREENEGQSSPMAERYLMKSLPHGIAIIINNIVFQPNSHALQDRNGSQIDSINLQKTWKYLSYDPRIFENLTASGITQQLMQIALENHKDYDSFVCCILSHGYRDGVYGTDGHSVTINEIATLFKGNFCPSLTDKPKLFFIQACRGDDEDKGVNIQKDGPPSNDAFPDSIPANSDFLFSYATPSGHASWRSTRYGSWYISELCEVLVDNAHHQDLLSMLTMVNRNVSEAHTTKGQKQSPSQVHQLRKKVWFF